MLLGQIKLADHDGVGAAAREVNEPAPMLGRHRRAAAPHPVLGFRLRQQIDVEQRLPIGIFAAIACERRAPPQTLSVLGVLPEIVHQLAALPDPRDAVGRVENVENGSPVIFELRIAKRRYGLAIARFDPGANLRAVDFFQPKIRIIRRGGFGSLGIRGGLLMIRHALGDVGRAIEGWNATRAGRGDTCCACTVATVRTAMAIA